MTTNALTKAFSDCERSYLSCKANVGRSSPGPLAAGATGAPGPQHFTASNDGQKLAAMKSWVWVATRVISNRIAQQPFKAGHVAKHRRRIGVKSFIEANNMEVLEDHPAVELLKDPSDQMTGFGHLWVTVASICLTGRALWWVTKIDGEHHMFYIPVSWIVGHTGDVGYTGFTIRPPGHGEAYTLPSDECVFFSLPDPSDPWRSVSPLQAVVESVNSDHDILTSQRAAFRNGIHPGLAVVVGKQPVGDVPGGLRPNLTAAQQSQIVAAIKKRFQGAHRNGEPVVLDGLIESIQKITNVPDEMGYQASGKDVRDRILMAFGVSGYCVGASEPGSRAASAVADHHFVQNVCRPIVALINSALVEWYLPIVSEGDDRLRLWLEEPEVDDQEMHHRKIELCAQHGALSVPELRRYAGLPEDKQFDNTTVGGKDMGTTGLIQRGLEEMIQNGLAAHEAEQIVSAAKSFGCSPGRNGRRITQ